MPSVEWADFKCRLCAGDELKLYYRQGAEGQFRYYRCTNCHLVNLDLKAGLDQAQYTDDWVDPTDDSASRNRDNDATYEFICRRIARPGRLLDLGCGNGRLLYRARLDGWQAKGVELSAEAAVRVQAEIGVPVVAANFLEMTPAEEDRAHFDLVCLRHVLEHLPDSQLAMNKIRELLAPGGMVLVEMPNIEGIDTKLKRWMADAGLHRKKYPSNFVVGHCNEFSRGSFEYLAAQTGFHLLRWETYSKKRLTNFIYNRIPIGNKARALIRVSSTQSQDR